MNLAGGRKSWGAGIREGVTWRVVMMARYVAAHVAAGAQGCPGQRAAARKSRGLNPHRPLENVVLL